MKLMGKVVVCNQESLLSRNQDRGAYIEVKPPVGRLEITSGLAKNRKLILSGEI